MIRKMLTLKGKDKLTFASALLLGVFTIVTGVGLMSTSGYLISRAAERPMLVDLFMVTAAVRFFGISRAVVRYTERLVSHDFTFKFLLSLRTALYNALDERPLKWMMGKRPGDLLGRLVADVEAIQHAYLRIIMPVIVAGIISMITCLLLWFFDPLLAVTTLLSLGLCGLAVPMIARKRSKGRGRSDVKARSSMKVLLVDKLQGVHEVHWLGQSAAARQHVEELQHRIDSVQRSNAGTSGLLEGLNTTIIHAATLVVLVLAIPMVMGGEIAGVMLAALTLGVLSSFEAVQGLGQAFIHYEASGESARRVFSILDKKADKITLGSKQMPKPMPDHYDIAFKKVSFSYDMHQLAIKDVSFRIAEGSKVAIIGSTGSGKSTLANLLLRFWDVDKGLITIGQNDIRLLDTDQLRGIFSVMAQDAYIFNRSLRENLLIADPGASDDKLQEVLRQIGLASYASRLDMEPGNMGMQLSGGERQLLALARVLLKNAPVFIFDEATAHLDVRTERKVLDTISNTVNARTQIMITHRLADLYKMDQVIVIEGGHIATQPATE